MALYPRFLVGLNKLDAPLLNRLIDMLRWFETNKDRVEMKNPRRRRFEGKGGGKAFWVARITGIEPLGSNQWAYEWEELKLQPPLTYFHDDAFRSASEDFDTWARNLAEYDNDGAGVEGYGIDTSGGRDADFSYNVRIQPIPVGKPVQMWSETDTEGNVSYWFQVPNEPAVTAKCAADTGVGVGI